MALPRVVRQAGGCHRGMLISGWPVGGLPPRARILSLALAASGRVTGLGRDRRTRLGVRAETVSCDERVESRPVCDLGPVFVLTGDFSRGLGIDVKGPWGRTIVEFRGIGSIRCVGEPVPGP